MAAIALLVALTGSIVAALQYWNALLTRRNQMFELRFAYYERLRIFYIAIQSPEMDPDPATWVSFAEEADFLFGKDISEHVLAMETHSAPLQVQHRVVDDWFTEPFQPYLRVR